MRGAQLDYAGTVYVLDPRGRPIGQVPLTTLLASSPDRVLRELMAELPPVAELVRSRQDPVVWVA